MYKFQIQQYSKDNKTAVLVGCLKFTELNKKNKVRFSFREESGDFRQYQRRVDDKRAREIAKYIESSVESSNDSVPIFPTSIILALDNEKIDFEKLNFDEVVELEQLPDEILIVDGQHRFRAFQILYEKLSQYSLFDEDGKTNLKQFVDNYRFNCTVLLNYDLWDQAQIFASVNFNQRKVNKSLFYDIYGIIVPDGEVQMIPKHNEIYLAHQLVHYLNGNDKSPFSGFIKMLGTGKGFISQAFLVEQFLKHFSINGIWADVVDDLRKGSPKKLQNYVAIELSTYFFAVKEVFSKYWPKSVEDSPSVLCKTTGIAAVLEFLEDLHHNMDSNLKSRLKNYKANPNIFDEIIKYFINNLMCLQRFQDKLFSTKEIGDFNGTGGKGLQGKLYKRISELWRENYKRH